MRTIEISGRNIGPGEPCFIIAEIGVNHNGDVGIARQLVDIAVQAGADAVKFQTFRTELLVSKSAPKAEYQQRSTGGSESQFDMLRALELSDDEHRELFTYCHERGIIFLSTPFDHNSADFLHTLGVSAFKIPSGETVNLPMLRHVALKQLPIILSTGMSTLGEVEAAVRTIRQAGNEQIVSLHCVSNYPADFRDINLRAMHTISQSFNLPSGFSDHTMGIEIPLAAAAMGASVIEKHFTLSREMNGPDHQASLEPNELTSMINGIRNIESALGTGVKEPAESERNITQVARRSIHLHRSCASGSVLTADDLIALRPGGGIAPNQFDSIVGRTLKRDMPKGIALDWADLE